MSDGDAQANWILESDDDNITWLCLDKQDSNTNVLSGHIMAELNERLAEIESMAPRALVLYSGKKNGFIAGADIKEFTGLKDPEQAYSLIKPGQDVLTRLAALPCPTVGLINGFALGGGLEVVLACDFRIVVDNPKATLGMPEVNLGIHPGFGGTVRSVAITGVARAMEMMLTGRPVGPDKALRIGLVDAIVPADELREAGRRMALAPPPPKRPGLKDRLMNLGFVRHLVASKLRQQIARKARPDHYPAPYAIVDLWRRYGDNPARMLDAEARSIAQLMCSETSRNLVRVFMLQDRLKSIASRSKAEFHRVHVVGAGVMGGDIAAWCALRGLDVTLQDRGEEYIMPAIKRAAKLFDKKIRDEAKRHATGDRLRADVEGAGVAEADIVIEAIFEDSDAKKTLYKELEPRMNASAVLATNTSSIRLETLCEALERPERLIGLHFFNPVAKMPLVEVIQGSNTSEEELAKGLAFAKRIGKLPLPCRSAPGFVVNRALLPYMMEAILAAEEGVPLVLIDRAATDFGMPMGPIELTDTVGLDVGYHVGRILSEAFDLPVPAMLEELVEKKQLGRKTGRGFYEYQDNKPVKPAAGQAETPADLQDRLILPMLNESVALLREGVVADEDLLDAGAIFGTGFAPFRGGPINYARARGINDVVASLNVLAKRYGNRFEPDVGWEDLKS
ncbi:MAG: 3-hydroxyacyl-CoA dehydrogenase NAD-binding domain-containing protein [Gammaproteobacteria bacterium]